MGINFWYWLKYPFKLFLYQVIDMWVSRKDSKVKEKTLLIFRLDLIGDFVISMPFFSKINQSGRFSGYTISLACNEIVEDLVLEFDKNTFDHVIYINRPKFLNSIQYRMQILSTIRNMGFEVVICPMHTRQFLLESIVKCSGAKLKIGATAIGKHMFKWQQILADSWYDELVINTTDNIFEFYRNQLFFNSATKNNLKIYNTKVNLEGEYLDKVPDAPFILFAPGASVYYRRWSTNNFSILARNLFEKYKIPIFVIGSKSESILFSEIYKNCDEADYLVNLCGQLSLSESIYWMSKANLLVCNESAPVHMAGMVSCHTICISNGNHYRRWNPYPSELANNVKTMYPKSFLLLNDIKKDFYYSNSCHINISEISTMEVLEALEWIFP